MMTDYSQKEKGNSYNFHIQNENAVDYGND